MPLFLNEKEDIIQIGTKTMYTPKKNDPALKLFPPKELHDIISRHQVFPDYSDVFFAKYRPALCFDELSPAVICTKLQSIYPAFYQCTSNPKWTPKSKDLPLTWLVDFWTYVEKTFSGVKTNFQTFQEIFGHWYLVPTKAGVLAAVKDIKNLVSPRFPASLSETFAAVGSLVFDHKVSVECTDFISPHLAKDELQSLILGLTQNHVDFSKLPNEEKESLVDFFSRADLDSLSEEDIQKIRQFPLWKIGSKYVDLTKHTMLMEGQDFDEIDCEALGLSYQIFIQAKMKNNHRVQLLKVHQAFQRSSSRTPSSVIVFIELNSNHLFPARLLVLIECWNSSFF